MRRSQVNQQQKLKLQKFLRPRFKPVLRKFVPAEIASHAVVLSVTDQCLFFHLSGLGKVLLGPVRMSSFRIKFWYVVVLF